MKTGAILKSKMRLWHLLLLFVLSRDAAAQFFNISSSTWEQEYGSGKWSYIKNVAAERARNALIATFVDTYGGADSKKGGTPPPATVLSILDVGCGEG
jgi:2-polyprenyl-3-methyl-5-hydroxy-6-metoxy-1,4-benzoquinol methylase